MDVLNYVDCLYTPERMTDITSWHGHIPFAFALIKACKPTVFVELGVHKGDSYSAFCQGVAEQDIDTLCYGVDCWEGDEHAGYYECSVYDDLRMYHDPRYSTFSTLIKSTFDDALQYFSDRTIDLLHIDGLHTYEAVRHDFESWLPKMSKKGIVLFHDINVRENGFGVWKLWEELRQRYPHFQLDLSHGLGLLAVGDQVPEELEKIISESLHAINIKKFYSYIGLELMLKHENGMKIKALEELIKNYQEQAIRITDEENGKREQFNIEQRELVINNQQLCEELKSTKSKLQQTKNELENSKNKCVYG